MKRFRQTLCLLLLLLAGSSHPQSGGAGEVRVFTIDGAIGPAISAYLESGIRDAAADGAYMVVLRMDTPGGLDTAMRDIIQAILDSPIPVVSYVHPEGARAASAGTYILYASHVAAMAPATNLGAATPVQIGMPGAPETPGTEEDTGPPEPTATERKAINDATAYIRALAERNGRNAAWAEQAVTEAASLSANEALAEDVIDIVATDLDDLLRQLQGRQVRLSDRVMTLDTVGRTVVYDEMNWQTRFLTVLTNPSLILVLGMIGLYGLIIEFYSPGFGLGGVVGVICLLLAAYGLQLLPINYAGLGLILLGMALMAAEALVPSFGILGAGGIIAFLVGGVMLVDTEVDVFQVSIPLLVAIATFTAALLILTLRMLMRLRTRPLVTGMQTFAGLTGESLDDFSTEGMVRVQGELWQARTDTPLRKGEKIRVLAADGLHLRVTKG